MKADIILYAASYNNGALDAYDQSGFKLKKVKNSGETSLRPKMALF